ncbi:MAG TPA: trypsin-like peptidase domain-containing protein [Acetobacteraceae bacterium]|nr:trypsin-like peptidase domain-containing protein [Acetobacteraceae bacterium]
MNQAELVRRLLPTVVNITGHIAISAAEAKSQAASSTDPAPLFKTAAGSGFVVDPTGIIATNWHVVDGTYELFVTFSDGERVPAHLIGAARVVDIAVLKVDAGHPLTAIKWGDSSKVRIGDPVLAIGNPLGVGLSVTAGIVSAVNRNIMESPVDDFIQTDAPINHGNSGGPLFDMNGEVIGMNAALLSPTAASAGLGFAIPSDDARFIVERLMRSSWIRPGWIGAKVQPVTPDIALGLHMSEPRGSIVSWVTDDSPADIAGIRTGDVILRLDGIAPSDDRALIRGIARTPPGQTVKVTVLRDGQELTLPVVIAEWPKTEWEAVDAPTKAELPHWTVPADLGLKLEPLTPELRAKNELDPGWNGLLVSGVEQGTDAAQRGVKPGDVLLQIGATPVSTAVDVQQQINRLRAEKRKVALFLILPKRNPDENLAFAGPTWYALRLVPEF